MSLSFIYDTFHPYCQRHGIHLMKEDLRYIAKMLIKIPEDRRKRVMRDYIYEWHSGMGEAYNGAQRSNLGRKRANLWLREVCSS